LAFFFSGKKKRGRPKKVERKDDQDYVPPALMEEGSKDTQTPKPLDSKLDQANAVEGLLDLSNTEEAHNLDHLFFQLFLDDLSSFFLKKKRPI
jgi:hypothetical protein